MEAVFRYGRAYTLKMGILQNFLACLIIFSLFCFHSAICCSIFENPFGNVSDDQVLEVGSPFTFQCQLFPDKAQRYGVSAEDLILKGPFKGNITQTDNYTVEYRVEKSYEDDSGLYHCFVDIPGRESPQLVCTSSITVGTKPKEVTNFNCIGYSLKNLNCSWTPPLNRPEAKYTLSDYLSNDSRMVRSCPIPERSSCMFSLDTKPPYLRDTNILNFILKGENALGTIEQHFSIRHFEIVKPDIPSKVSLKNVSKDSMVIEILAPKGLEYGEYKNTLVYKIKYYSVSTKLNVIGTATVANRTNAHLEIRSLVPYTQYTFEVRCHLNVTGDHYYMSDEVKVTDITKPDVPYQAPGVDISGFDVLSIDNNNSITLYWKAVPSEFENGQNFHYVVRYHDYFVPDRLLSKQRSKRELAWNVDIGNVTTHTIHDLEKDSAYIFSIVAANDEGQSTNNTAVIVVDKANKLLKGPKDITVVLYNQGHYDISWKSPDPLLNTFTIAACETLQARPAKCDGPISFIPVNNKTHYKFSILNSQTNYQFAVATTAEKKTSGLYWAPCIVTYGVVYGVKSVQMMPKTSTSLKLSWSYICPAVSRVVREIEIAMCPSQETCSARNFERCSVNDLGISGWPTHRITNSSATEMIIGDLRPFTQYYAVIRVRTDAGWGSYSGFGCESTMPSAPGDPPSDVYAEITPVQDSMKASIRVSFEPPNTPNGVISRYVVYYNNTSSSEDGKEKEVRIQDNKGTSTTLDNISYHTNYSIEVTACVGQACSPLSEPFYLYTGVSNPGMINLPRVELGEAAVNVSWELPVLPNGPLDYYQILMISKESGKEKVFNVSGQNFLSIERRCDTTKADHSKYEFKVRAINVRDGMPLEGDYSSPLQTLICSEGSYYLYYAGIGLGVFIVLFVFSIGCYKGYRFFSKNYNAVTKTEVKLPKALDSSLDNPLSLNGPYNFKGEMQNNRDYAISYEKGYERFFSAGSRGDMQDTEELTTRDSSGRNLSGESNFSGKCHDSISSANTTKTHNSDSGAEIESPPSPDSFCSDSGSANTTPRAFKPGLDIVNEINLLTSKDSGLEKEGFHRVTPNTNFSGKSQWYVRRPNDAQLGAYSRFAVQGASNTPPYVPHGEQNLVDCLSLSNSEPSVADFDVGDGTEPLVNPVMQPYSKFGLARSASNGINLSRDMQPIAGYSKFGIVYRPLKSSPQKCGHHDQQVFPVIPVLPHPNPFFKKKEDASLSGIATAPVISADAYSKFGVVDSIDHPGKDPMDIPGNPSSGFGNLTDQKLVGAVGGFKRDPGSPHPDDVKLDKVASSLSSNLLADARAVSNRIACPELCPSSGPVDSLDLTNVLQSPMNGPSPSQKTLDDQSPEEEDVPDFADAQFADVLRKSMCGGFVGVGAVPVNDTLPDPVSVQDSQLPAPPTAKPENYAFTKALSSMDDILMCIENNCLPQLSDADTDGDFSDDVPAGNDSENDPLPNHPVPNVYIRISNIPDLENVAQVDPQSNSSVEMV